MAIENFIPQIWAARGLEHLDKAHVYAAADVVNRDYEGEISGVGDSVKINQIGDVTIGTYSKNTSIGAPQTLTDAQTVMVIDQSKYYNFMVDDVDAVQQKPKVMDMAMQRASYGLGDASDQHVASKMATDATIPAGLGTIATPISDLGTAGKAYEYLVNINVALHEANVPMLGRWVIVPPWFYGLLQKDDRFVKAGTVTTDEILRMGVIDMATGLRIKVSNNVPNTSGTKYRVIAGYPGAVSYAEQIVKVEAFRHPEYFGDAVKGLHVYGCKVVRPDALIQMIANKPS